MNQKHDAPEGGFKVGDKATIVLRVVEVSHTGKCWKGVLTDDESDIWFDADDLAPTPPAPSGLVDAALLREVVDKGLIYWEPNTSRGAVAKADMLARCELALSSQQGTPPAPSGLVDAVRDPWVDTRLVRFDDTIVWGEGGFDFDAWESLRWEMHYPGAGSYAVWPNGSHGKAKRWSFYGGPDGVLALERFTSEADAKSETEAYALSIAATRATLDATLSGQQGGAVPAGEVTAQDLLDALNAKPGISFVATIKDVQDVLWELRRARLAEQPAPAGTGADGVEGLRKAAESSAQAAERELSNFSTMTVCFTLEEIRDALRAALDGASGQEER